MAPDADDQHRPRRLSAELRTRESVKPLELFFDLVFVVGFTRCTSLMAEHADWASIGRALLVLAMLWWAWICFAWLTSVVEPEEGSVRIVMLAVMGALLVAALYVPGAFTTQALGFAIAYGLVRVGHIALFVIASRDDSALRRSVIGFGVTAGVAICLLVGASFVDEKLRPIFWIVAIIIDWGEPAVFGGEGWRLVPMHFAERHNLIVIIALGESIIAIDSGAQVSLDGLVVAAAVLGLALAAAMWWIYFDVVALVTEQRLMRAKPGPEQNALARDSYSYLHFPMIAGIMLAAFGLEETLAHVDKPLDVVPASALLGGTALYLLAHVALRLRTARTLNVERLAVALLLFALIAPATQVDALVAIVGVNVIVWAMIVYETVHVYDEGRYALRHGVEFQLPEDRRTET